MTFLLAWTWNRKRVERSSFTRPAYLADFLLRWVNVARRPELHRDRNSLHPSTQSINLISYASRFVLKLLIYTMLFIFMPTLWSIVWKATGIPRTELKSLMQLKDEAIRAPWGKQEIFKSFPKLFINYCLCGKVSWCTLTKTVMQLAITRFSGQSWLATARATRVLMDFFHLELS